MLEGKTAKITYTGQWGAWFDNGEEVEIVEFCRDMVSTLTYKKGKRGLIFSESSSNAKGRILDISKDEYELIKMLYPGIEKYLWL